MNNTAVLLLQMGGPDSLEAVKPFLLNLFSDREIIKIGPAWLQPFIARMIAGRRALLVAEKYREIGGKSPIRELTQAQADALAAELGIPCHVGMRAYWHPLLQRRCPNYVKPASKGWWHCRCIPTIPAPPVVPVSMI